MSRYLRRVLALLPVVLAAASTFARGQEGPNLDEKLEAARQSGRAPVIGIALSGGGARGFAHIGVLQAMEEMGIPVDRVAGTSMGSVIGGLYACGYRPSKIEEIVLRIDWNEIFRGTSPRSRMALFERQESGRYLVSLPMDRLRIRLPTGFTQGERITSVLSLLMVNALAVDSFDGLPVPFRAVSTDLVTGERIAMASGSLPEAIRASMAFPLFFTPVEIEGRLLVDGGLVDNFPVDVAKEMGSEIVIGSDVTSPLREKGDLTTPLGVGDQAISLQMVASARKMRDLADAAVVPDLTEITHTAFQSIREIILAGYQSARQSPELRRIAEALAGLKPEARTAPPAPVLSGIRVEGEQRFTRRQLADLDRAVAGKSLEVPALPQAIRRAVGQEFFRTAHFHLAPGPDGNSLLVMEVSEKQTDRFNFSARADDKYGALGLVNLSFRNLAGGDNAALLDIQVGSFSRLSAQLLHPSTPGTSFFWRPEGFWFNDFQMAYSDDGRTGRYVDRRWGCELQAGNTFRNLGAVTLGYRFVSTDFHRDTGMSPLSPFLGRTASLILRSHVDTLDRAEIPDSGRLMDLALESARKGLGGDLDFDRARLDYAGYRTWRRRHTLTTGLSVGAAFGGSLPDFEQFRLGGVDFLWGLKREELRGDYTAGVRAGYRLLVSDFGNSFVSRLYLEAGVDGANAWRDRDSVGGGLIPDGYLSLWARTWLGPFRLTVGTAEGGRRNATFFFGHSF